MEFSNLIPIIIFLYAAFTIFGSDSSKNQKKKPTNYQEPSDKPQTYKYQPKKESRSSGWREMFEELERELFSIGEKMEEPARRPYPTPTPSPAEYSGRDRERVEEVLTPRVESSRQESYAPRVETLQPNLTPQPQSRSTPQAKNPYASGRQSVAQPSGFIPSSNPLVQGVIWAEVLGKPRSLNPWNHRGKNF